MTAPPESTARSLRRSCRALRPLGAVALFALLLTPWVDAQVRPVEDWSSQPVDVTGVPAGWSRVSFIFAANFTVKVERGERVLHLRSRDDHSIISKELGGIDLAATPVLEWRWRVDEVPRGANLSRNDRSDSAVEIHLGWKADRRTLGYAWDETLPAGGPPFENPRKRGVHFLIVTSGPARPGTWVTVARNVVNDHVAAFGRPPARPPDLIAISIDSNQTHSTAEAYVGAIRFRAP